MKESFTYILITIALSLVFGTAYAQEVSEEKKYSLSIGTGYFVPLLSEDGIAFSNATYDPQIGAGLTYFASFDYAVSEKFSVGLGFNGNHAGADFIRDVTVNDELVNGYLEAGAVANAHLVINCTYVKTGEGIEPFAKLGLGYFTEEVELGDVPLELTDNIEVEMFPDFKSSGFGVLPEIGVRYNAFSFSAAYSLPFDDLTGEAVKEGFVSTGSIASQGLQFNVAYKILLF